MIDWRQPNSNPFENRKTMKVSLIWSQKEMGRHIYDRHSRLNKFFYRIKFIPSKKSAIYYFSLYIFTHCRDRRRKRREHPICSSRLPWPLVNFREKKEFSSSNNQIYIRVVSHLWSTTRDNRQYIPKTKIKSQLIRLYSQTRSNMNDL